MSAPKPPKPMCRKKMNLYVQVYVSRSKQHVVGAEFFDEGSQVLETSVVLYETHGGWDCHCTLPSICNIHETAA
jgi:hypothetical protein